MSNAVGIICVKDGKILCGYRHNTSDYGKLCGPGGHIDPGENSLEAAKRETEEEFGIAPEDLLLIGQGNFDNDLYLCTKWSGEPQPNDMEMVNPGFKTLGEISEEDCFEPFTDGLNVLVEKIGVREDWDEEEHPRDEGGKFSEKEAGGSSKPELNKVVDGKITMTYVRVTGQKTQNYGSTYGQNLEPAGEYMSMDTMQGKYKIPGYEYGTIRFNHPLILEHKNTGETGWKKDLSDRYNGKTGKRLSNAIIKDGYDAVMTKDGDDFVEIVNLKGEKMKDNRLDEIRKKYNHDSVWNESDHPRDGNGRFSSSGGSSSGGSVEKARNSLKNEMIDYIKKNTKAEYRDEVSEDDFDRFEKGVLNKIDRANDLAAEIKEAKKNNTEWSGKVVTRKTKELDDIIRDMEWSSRQYDDGYDYEKGVSKKALEIARKIRKSIDSRTDGWDENKHPRGEGGMFTPACSGRTNGPKPVRSADKFDVPKITLHNAAKKEAKKIGTSMQTVNGDLYVAFSTGTIYPGSSRPSRRAWGKVVEKSDGRKVGKFGKFDVYSPGLWRKGDNDSYGYEFVLNDREDGAPIGNRNAAGPHDMSGSGKAEKTSGRMSQSSMDSMIDSMRGRALTSYDVKEFANKVDKAAAGDSIWCRENNSWHNITSTYTKTDKGWRYTRKNERTGDVYEDRDVTANEMARSVLGTSLADGDERQKWAYRGK